MPKKLIDLFRLAFPLSKENQEKIVTFRDVLPESDIQEIVSQVKQKKITLSTKTLNVSPQISDDVAYTFLDTAENDLKPFVESINTKISEYTMTGAFQRFSKIACEVIPKFIAMNIVGLDLVKQAAAIQLFSDYREPVHILLLGDPGTGKTDILRSVANISPISSFGLGSGTSGVGLTVTVIGDEVKKGLLPMADKGICAIDELNLMQDKDRAALYNAMEKGFITYDKGGKHFKFDSKIKVIATANPKGDRFAGWTIVTLKTQLPFDSALLTRFHLVFLIRKPDVKQFVEISRKLVKGDQKKMLSGDENFIGKYVDYASKLEVEVPKDLEQEIVDFMTYIKTNEKHYLLEISPRLVLGFIRLAKASARMKLHGKVDSDDIEVVKKIVKEGLRIDRDN